MKKIIQYSAIMLIALLSSFPAHLEGSVNKIKIYKRWNEELQKNTDLIICLNNNNEKPYAKQIKTIKYLIDKEPNALFLFSDPFSIDLSEIKGSISVKSNQEEVMDQYRYAIEAQKIAQNISTKLSFFDIYRLQFKPAGSYGKDQLLNSNHSLRSLSPAQIAEILSYPIKKVEKEVDEIIENYESLPEKSPLKDKLALSLDLVYKASLKLSDIKNEIALLSKLAPEDLLPYLFNKFKGLNNFKEEYNCFIELAGISEFAEKVRVAYSLADDVNVQEFLMKNTEILSLTYGCILLYLSSFIDFDFGFIGTIKAILEGLNKSKIYLFRDHLEDSQNLDIFLSKLGYNCIYVYTDDLVETDLQEANKLKSEVESCIRNDEPLTSRVGDWLLRYMKHYTSLPAIRPSHLKKLININELFDSSQYKFQATTNFEQVQNFTQKQITTEKFIDFKSKAIHELPDYKYVLIENGSESEDTDLLLQNILSCKNDDKESEELARLLAGLKTKSDDFDPYAKEKAKEN